MLLSIASFLAGMIAATLLLAALTGRAGRAWRAWRRRHPSKAQRHELEKLRREADLEMRDWVWDAGRYDAEQCVPTALALRLGEVEQYFAPRAKANGGRGLPSYPASMA